MNYYQNVIIKKLNYACKNDKPYEILNELE